jgi:asparagine synthase (glutamine-hydrolysing)
MGLPQIETYSIGLENSVDLKNARIVADYLGTKHNEIILTEDEFISAIPEVIYAIESYDTTTVRASIGNYLVAKYISQHSDAKVIFNGDGADELMGGYLYMRAAPNALEYDKEIRRLLDDICYFDVLRSDRSISSNGLEPRTPFLDRTFVQYYMSIPIEVRQKCSLPGVYEKELLRLAFSKDMFKNYHGYSLLPDEILFRKKEAFSDGVSGKERSLYQIIGEFAEKIFQREDEDEDEDADADLKYVGTNNKYSEACKTHIHMNNVNNNLPTTAEQFYYRKLFETFYSGNGNVIPYFWMPKFVNANDASARTLDLYKEKSD